MIFKAQIHQCYHYIITIKPLYRYLLSLCMLVMLWSVWFWFLYQPLNNKIVAHQKMILLNKQKFLQKEKSQIQLKEQLSLLQKNIKNQCSSYRTCEIQHLLTLCANTELTCNGITCNPFRHTDGHLVQSVQIELHGSLSMLLDFFERIKTERWCLYPKKLHINFHNDIYYHCNVTFDSYRLLAKPKENTIS